MNVLVLRDANILEQPGSLTVIGVDHPLVRTGGGGIWRGTVQTGRSFHDQSPILAVTGEDQWIEVAWQQRFVAVGVQFWGNEDDGEARILVDGEEVWNDAIVGDVHPCRTYVEVQDLVNAQHTVRIEAVAEGGHATVAAFSGRFAREIHLPRIHG